jgi:copper chaperone CopZ
MFDKKTMRYLYLFILLVSIIACKSNSENQEKPANSSTEQANEKTVVSNYVATFAVDGMMCQKGCGATIRGGLYKTGGVSDVVVNFEEEGSSNEINVFYDASKTNTDEMVKVISELADNRYSADLKSNVAKEQSISQATGDVESSTKHAPMRNIESSTESISFPNLTHLLNSLIH